VRFDPGVVHIDARAVDHEHVLVVGHAVDDAVVDDAAVFVEQEAVAAAPGAQGGQVVGHDAREGVAGLGAAQLELAHVADVEDRGLGAGMLVFFKNAAGVLDGHVPSGKGDHPGAVAHVPGMQGGLE
jgi:hypothetical protein